MLKVLVDEDNLEVDEAYQQNELSTDGSTTRKKRTRGKTRNLDLIKMSPGQKIRLDFNQYGQPIGVNASKFSSFLGNHVRNDGDIPISFEKWEDVPDEQKQKIYMRVLEKFEFEETDLIKFRIMQNMRRKFDGIEPNDWKTFVEYHDRETTQKICAQNKENRGKQVLPHYTGSKSYVVIRAEQAEMDPEHREPTSWKMFCIAHTKSDASLNSTPAQEIVDKFKALAQESDSSTPTTEDEIYRQIVRPEKHGRTRGYGLGPTPTTVFGTTPRRVELASQL
ncbi:hypothetical protein Cni_G07526 [Canna indica]|uniref:Uncharacterized protein n=1 Tax=Canna indica TaxID=4628 RepID=A0AAQ3Q7M1_9LILI|nr:hypothetical protein Cni_G07526 [Canna indica]